MEDMNIIMEEQKESITDDARLTEKRKIKEDIKL